MENNEQFLKGRESKSKEMEYDIEKTYNKAIECVIKILDAEFDKTSELEVMNVLISIKHDVEKLND